jgi:glycosyltransferase involved in cell wall biosynthesis
MLGVLDRELSESRWTLTGEAQRKALLDQLGLTGAKIILYGGMDPSEEKLSLLYESMLEVVSLEPKARLLIVNGEPSVMRHIRKFREALAEELYGYVWHIPGIPSVESTGWYLLADVIVLLSMDEESIRAARNYGVPVVAPRLDAMDEWILNGRTGWLISPELLERNLAPTLLDVLQDQTVARRMGELSRSYGQIKSSIKPKLAGKSSP